MVGGSQVGQGLFLTRGIVHYAALALTVAMVSSLLGSFLLEVDAIPDEKGFSPDGKGSQITNHSHARPGSTYKWNYNPSDFVLDAGSVSTGVDSMEVSLETVDALLLASDQDNTGFPIQPGDPGDLQGTVSGLSGPLNNAFSDHEVLGAPEFTYDEGVPFWTYLDTVGPEVYGYVEIHQSVPTPRL